MTEPNHGITPQSGPPMQPAIPPRKPWPVERRERRLLPVSLLLSYLLISFLLDWMGGRWMRLPGLGVTVLTAGWYAALFVYRGTAGLERRVNRLLLGAAALLALTFVLFSNQWFRYWNCGALALVLAVHTWELCGGARLPWDRAGMLLERLWLLVKGPFVRCGALLDAAQSARDSRKLARSLPVLIGAAVTVPALWLITRVLMDADALFALAVGRLFGRTAGRLGPALARLLLAVCVTPFTFSLLYFAAHTEQKDHPVRLRKKRESLPAAILLGAMDGLYLFFLAVQSAALFGGPAYLAQAGISYASYARSGFFQLVGLTGLNAAVILSCLWLCRADRRLRILSTALAALTAVLLVSAAWRMTLYVSAYGLSFKRLLTYWGMVMLAILLALTLRKIWREEFSLFRAAAPIALAGWLVLNYCSIDAIAVRYNAAQVSAGRLAESAVGDLFYSGDAFSYDGLNACRPRCPADPASHLREMAEADCQSWTTWSLSAYLASRG